MKVCFIMYPWERVDPESDSTLRLIHECVSRGHMVAITTPNNLTVRSSITSAFCRIIRKDKITTNIPSFYRKAEFTKHMLPLGGFDVIFRKSRGQPA